MEAIECIKTRRSIRNFSDKKVEKGTIKEIIETTSFAPSWKNSQTVRYTVVENEDIKSLIANEGVMGFEFNKKTILKSNVIAVQSVVTGICGYEPDGTFSTDKKNGWEMYDAGISAQTFCLAAHEKGVGTVIMGIFDADKIHKFIKLPENQVVTAVIAMGYPLEKRDAPQRKNVDEILNFI